MDKETAKEFVRSRYPDAMVRKYASRSFAIWSPVLNSWLSKFFITEEGTWENAMERRMEHEKKFTTQTPKQ